MRKKLLILVVLLLVSVPNLAESVDTTWVSRYNGPGNTTDGVKAIAVDGSGNVYVTGPSFGSGTYFDFTTIKYYSDGDTAWVRRYNGPGNGDDFAQDITADDSGNVYVTGSSLGSGTNLDYATIKYNPNGDTAWVRRYDGPASGSDIAKAIALDDSGFVYVTGYSDSTGSFQDYATIKYDSAGKEIWVGRYNGPGNSNDIAQAMFVDDSANVYVTGMSYSSGTNFDYATIKYLPNGTVAAGWPKMYNNTAASMSDQPRDIVVDDSGYVYVTGESEGIGTSTDYLTIKYYSNGNVAWEERYNNQWNTDDRSYSIALDGAGNVFVAGVSGGHNFTIKYNSGGDTVWTSRYVSDTSPESDTIDWNPSIVTDSCNNLYLAGSINTSDTSWDYITIKYTSDGDTAWVKSYNGPGSYYDIASAIAVYGCEDVYVTGSSIGDGTGYDFATIKYQSPGDVKDETGGREKPSEFALSQNYPNPFNPATKIEFTISKSGYVSLRIYDILGRKVRTLVSEHLSSGYKSVLWDGKNAVGKDVASGIYFYQLRIGDFSEAKKMLLLK
jgi:hypothetical protein